MRLIMMGPPGPARARRPSSSPTTSASRRSRPATSSAPTCPQGTELGVEAKRYMDAGEYVPDEVTNLMVRNRIDEPDAEPGFLLDGYPRTLAQVEELDGMIAFTGHSLDAAVVLTVDADEIVAAAAPAGPDRGSRRRHRGRHPPAPAALRRADRAADRGLPRPRHPGRGRRHGRGRRRHRSGSSTRSTSSRSAEEPDGRSCDRGIEIKTPEQIDGMRKAGLVVGRTLELLRDSVRAGVTTGELDAIAEDNIRSAAPSRRSRAKPPAVPGLDLRLGQRRGRARHPRRPGARRGRRHLDRLRRDRRRLARRRRDHRRRRRGRRPRSTELMRVTEESLWHGIAAARLGGRVTDISHAVEPTSARAPARATASSRTTSATASARQMHQPPNVPNYGRPGRGPKLVRGPGAGRRADGDARQQGDDAARRRVDGRHRRRLLGGPLRAHLHPHARRAPGCSPPWTAASSGSPSSASPSGAAEHRAVGAGAWPTAAWRLAQEGSIPVAVSSSVRPGPGPDPVPSVAPSASGRDLRRSLRVPRPPHGGATWT